VAYRLVALDIDGTLVGEDLEIKPQILRAVKEAQQRGVHVTIATGRMFAAALPFAQKLGIVEPLICYQGGMVRDMRTDEVIFYRGMDVELAAEAARVLQDLDLFVILYVDERLYMREYREELEIYLRLHPEGPEFTAVGDLEAFVREHVPTKILVCAQPEVITEQVVRLGEHFAGRLEVLRTHKNYVELMPLGITKGDALEALASRLGIARDEVIAIGDQENDLTMVQWAGLGLAMGNAIPRLKEVAKAVIPSVEEAGVAWAIEHYVLQDSPDA
jgi:Cof subfamily protein (haloacid dehalogenase superfamily)